MPKSSDTVIATKQVFIHEHLLYMRGQQIILDTSLASLYGVTTKRLNEQVKRNQARFPEDFTFQLTQAEKDEVVANCDHLVNLKFSRTLPYAFTEHGVIMVASVLNSTQAIDISVLVVRAFIKLRQMLANHQELHHKVNELEQRLHGHDETLQSIVETINQLIMPPAPAKKRTIGFGAWED